MKINKRGQIIIPKRLREEYGFDKGVEIEFIPKENGIRIQKRKPGTSLIDQARGIVKLKYTDTVDEFIVEIRGK